MHCIVKLTYIIYTQAIFAAYQKSQPRIIDLQGYIDNSQLKLFYDAKNPSSKYLMYSLKFWVI